MKAALVLLLAILPPAAAGAAGRPPELTGTVESEWALGLRGAHSQKLELVLQPELHWSPGATSRVTAIGRLRVDGFDRIEPGQPKPAEVSSLSRRGLAGTRVDYELRELYVELEWGRTWFTLGKQQVVWGQADGLKVLDVVNPQDFREFILDDFDDSRIPLWTLRAEIPVAGADLELLWIPDPSYHEIPGPDATFALRAPRFLPPRIPGLVPVLAPTDRPRRLLADSDAGLRLSAFVAGIDLSFNYLFHRDDRPVFEGQRRGDGSVVFTPRYRRTHLVGGTFSSAFGDLTVRGEIGWSSDRRLSVTDPTDPDLVGRTGELSYVIGLDWFGFRETLFSFQLFQSWLVRNRGGWLRDRLDSNVTVLARREFWNEQLRIEAIWIHNLNDGDGVVRPRLRYELASGLAVWAGFDVFYGRKSGVFGEFDGRDRATLGMEWGF